MTRRQIASATAAWRVLNWVGCSAWVLCVASALPAETETAAGKVTETSAVATRDQIDPATLAITAIKDLTAMAPDHLPRGLVRIQGAALPHRARDIIEVTDGTGSIMVQTVQPNRLVAGERHDFVGRPVIRAGRLVLDRAQFTLVRRLPAEISAVDYQAVGSLRDLQRLSAERADASLPVAVRGVVTYVDRDNNTLMIQDGTAGCWVGVSADQPPLPLGSELQLRGFTAPGDFAPIIIRPKIEFVGRPGLPAAALVRGHEFVLGGFDGMRTSLDGIVRGVVAREPQLVLEMVSDGNRIELRFPAAHHPVLPPQLLGARVRVTGVCAAQYNQFQQMKGFRLLVPDLAQVEVLAEGPRDFFALPLRPVRDLVRFEPNAETFGLKHVQGAVLFAIENQRIFLRDDTGTVEAVCRDTQGVAPGDVIEAAGYPELATFGKVLQDAVVRPSGRRQDIVPLPVDVEGNRLELLHGELLLLDAHYQGRLVSAGGTTLILRSGARIFDAFLPGSAGAAATARLEAGSELRLTGVLKVTEDANQSIAYSLILRSADDLAVIARPPWWTLGRALSLLSVVVVLSAVAIAWVAVQRRRAERKLRIQEDKLRQAQKMEAIGTLAGGIAHDFNNILTGILGYAELALMNLPPGSELQRDLENVRQAGNRARELVRQILTYSRRIEQPRRPVDPAVIVGEVGRLLRATVPTTIDISLKIDERCPRILGDPTQIHQVLMNLGTNSYHATRERGGTITIAVGPYVVEAPRDVDGTQLPAGRYAMLEVTDDGVGMPPEVLRRIFEPYYSTRHHDHGSGLGLAVVQGIVRAHGGAISAESDPGKGTRMRVLLPATDQPAAEAPAVQPEPRRGTGRILLVDDEPMIADLGKRMLESLGYEVVLAFSGSEALACLARERSFDLVITDHTMPHLTGLSLLEKLRADRPGLPVIICTGYSETLNAATARQHGAFGLIDKPFRQVDLADMVARALKQDAAPPA